MPNRLIREGFLDSEAVNRLSESAECLYHRLLLIADDAGRMDGRPSLLRARLYPLGTDRGTDDLLRLLHECRDHGLVHCYTFDDKPYVQIARWQRPGHSVYSKFPWRDGSHRVTWVKRETRDGTKEFCATSLQASPVSGAPQVLGDAVFVSPSGERPVLSRGEKKRGDNGDDGEGLEGENGGNGGLSGGQTAGVEEGQRVGEEGGSPFFASKLDPIEGNFRQMSEDGDEHGDVVSLPQRSAGPVSSRAGRDDSAPLASGEDVPARPWTAGRERDDGRQAMASASGVPPVAPGSYADRSRLGGEFQTFWQAYPKKRSRDAARRVWMQRRPPLDRCLAAIEQLRRTEEWRKDGGQFIPHPANWLTAGGWEDVPEVNLRRGPPGRLFLLPGESVPGSVCDPDIWPDYVAAFPVFRGKHLADLSAAEQEAFKSWAFVRQREAFLAERGKLGGDQPE